MIKNFLSTCRTKTYASGKKPEIVNGGKSYSIKEGDLEYRDTCFDQERYFQGQELLFEKGKPVWSMSYRGAAEKGVDTKEVFGFLQEILREHSDEVRLGSGKSRQVRLPGDKEYEDGEWRYQDKCEGGLEEFSGEEKIYKSAKLVHWMKYFGGDLR